MLDNYPNVKAGPPKPSRIIQPQVFSLPPGVERYVVEGQGAVLIPIDTGDQITIINDEGGQHCEVVVCDPKGRSDAGIIGLTATAGAGGLQALLTSNDKSLRGMRMGLDARKIDLAKAQAVHLFEATTPAKTEAKFTAVREGVVIIAAPAGAMDFEAQNTATPLTVMIKRAVIKSHVKFELPDPLADPLADIRVHTQTAESFFVKAGDYIQIIDVDGRQCSDFECFSARKLDKGIEHALDVTTTRTLMGHAYPMPGLHAKYYDQEMLPLVEVIQDTCGRHDAFAMACTEKYYNDTGYPGHANCSTNFNTALQDYGVAPRRGWMAINFFFNTFLDDHGVMYSDEPWSRPGDYVLLRALTDIVCVSSACPDDTTSANGWNPTDIHVRTYSGKETFQRSIAIRTTPDSEPKMTKQTGFHESFAKHTRNFVEYNGYWLANNFPTTGPIEEYHACRQKAAIIDLSPLRKFEIMGPDAEALCQYAFTRNIKSLATGAVVYTAMCYEHGGMIDDGTVFRLGRDNFRWIGGSDYSGVWLRELAEKLGLKVLVRSSTDQMHNVAVQGPESRDLLRKIVWTAPHNPEFDQLGWFRFTPARLKNEAGTAFVISRTGYTGELGYEVMCHPRDCTEIFDAIWEAGQDHGLKPIGLEALDMLRIEAGLIFAGYDFSDQTDPFEAGIGFTVPLKSKPDDFVGRDALIRRKENPMRKLVGLEIDSNVDVGHGDCIHIGRAQIGEVTSSMRSPLLGKNIALARIDVAHASAGTEVEIGKLDGHQKRIPAVIAENLAAFDPGKERPRS
ncbi:MAG: aminomethyltransferase family protein [Loktanella sp.]|nr:aminomethyltransferase family protein [Yoonia sp.]MDO7621904.1 aminomethyltransferase family protein [Loktanella sp.]MDO7627135.1 aminomethyltransferase family protein [Loktanella sp.]MDO7664318.1 aminomethyltransferase family protein [Loktanella sp.]MDO7685846.1 aminomethyltransferase family protein [Loktanella sp.]